jgi:poly(hydroxyalkanoate) depolymerase family esterase
MIAPDQTLLDADAPDDGGAQHRHLACSDAPGSRAREYWVYAPASLRTRARPGVVMVLHGCDQKPEELIRSTRFLQFARERGFAVVFPYVTSWKPVPWRANNCWGFWIEDERRRDEGEVGDLRRIFGAVELEFDTDPDRRYVAGLSSGGAMAAAMAATYPDAIQGVGTVAGLAFAETSAAIETPSLLPAPPAWFASYCDLLPSSRRRSLASLSSDMTAARGIAGPYGPVPLLVIQSLHDKVVPVENARMLRDVWLACHPEAVQDDVEPGSSDGAAEERSSYRDAAGRTIVETIFYEGRTDGPTHYWPGDGDDPPYADPTGPSATAALLDFFGRQGL